MACADIQVTVCLAAGLLAAIVAAVVGHGVLKAMLESRGVSPWTWRDSLGATPLVLLGSAAAAGAMSALLITLVGWPISVCGDIITRVGGVAQDGVATVGVSPTSVVAYIVVLCGGLLSVRLGLLALRKLSA